MRRNTRPLAVLHGWGGSYASTFVANGWLDHLAKLECAIHGIDLPGHGGGSHDPRDYSDLAGLVIKLLPPGRIDVIGYSLGGKLALAIAAREPDRFERIVVGGVGDNLFGPEAHGEAVAEALTKGMTASTPQPIAALVRYSEASRSDPLALAAVLRRPANPVVADADLKRVDSAVLIVNGADDRIANPDARLVQAVANCRLQRLPGIDHIRLPAAPAFIDAAVRFLSSN